MGSLKSRWEVFLQPGKVDTSLVTYNTLMDLMGKHFDQWELLGCNSFLLVATQIFFIFTPKIGEMIQFDEHIFQMGWNHQLVIFVDETVRGRVELFH